MDKNKIKNFLLVEEKNRFYYDFLSEYDELELEEINIQNIEEKDIAQASGIFIVFSQNEEWIDKILIDIRKKFITSLSPILVVSSNGYKNTKSLADNVITLPSTKDEVEAKIDSCISIIQEIDSFSSILDSLEEDRKRKIILLRFMSSRDKMKLEPKQSSLSPTKYYYPLASILLNVDTGKEKSGLEELEKMGMLSGEVVDKVYLCPSCRTSSISLKEYCPHCESIDINNIIALRHNSCSYTGNELDFKRPQLGLYICPKCKEELSADEVGKNKFPAFLCQSCGNIFKEPNKKFKCLSCGNIYKYEDLVIEDIKAYSITAEGIKAAETGILYDSLERSLISEGKKALIRDHVFKEVFYLETARSVRYKRSFCLMKVEIVDFKNIKNAQGEERANKLSDELFTLLYSNLRRTDVITSIEPGIFLILFLETTTEGSESALRKIKREVDKIFCGAIKISWKVISESQVQEQEIKQELEPLTEEKTYVNQTLLTKNGKTVNKVILKNIGIKSVFKYFTIFYLLFYGLFLFTGGIAYLAGKVTGLIPEQFGISDISPLFDRWGIGFLNYFGHGIFAVITFITTGFAISLGWGLLGILGAWIVNIILKISRGIELRFSSPPTKSIKHTKLATKYDKKAKRTERRQVA